MTFNKTLPNIRSAIDKTWNILQINKELAQTFQEKPIIAYRRNPNLRDMIGQTTMKHNKVERKSKKVQKGRCSPCLSRPNNLCCKQVTSCTTFKSNKHERVYQILHNTNCHSTFCIYLIECTKFKVQYIGKSETKFNIRLNNHRNDAYHPSNDTIPACKHFSNDQVDFNRHAGFTIIEQIKNNNKSSEQKRVILMRRENFWITNLETLQPNGLNKELNIINS